MTIKLVDAGPLRELLDWLAQALRIDNSPENTQRWLELSNKAFLEEEEISPIIKRILNRNYMSLLSEARKVKVIDSSVNLYDSEEHQELALAWLRDEVKSVQIQKVMEFRNAGMYPFLGKALKAAFESGRINIV